MLNINRCEVAGRLTRDPIGRKTKADVAVVNFTVATNSYRRDEFGDVHERTEYHRLVAFGKPAEQVLAYLRKGSQVYASGELCTTKWLDAQNQEHYGTELRVREFQFVDKLVDSKAAQSLGTPTDSAEGRSSEPSVNYFINKSPYGDSMSRSYSQGVSPTPGYQLGAYVPK